MGKFTYGQSGVSYECDKVDLKVNEGAPRCPRCEQRVYFNEEKKALGKSYHIRCFTCCECKKTLSSTNYNEFNGDIMCPTCHRRHSTSTVSQRTSYIATAGTTNSTAAAAADDDDVDEDGDDATSQSHSNSGESSSSSSRVLPRRLQTVNMQDAERCPHCGQTVYFAEEVKALKRKWHRLCFKCVSCKRTLEPGKCTEHDGMLFCHQCHHKRFGPHSLRTTPSAGFSSQSASDIGRRVGNGALAYTDTIETDGDGEGQMEPTQPIRGAQEWTESFVYNQPSTDYQQYRLQ